MGDTSIVYSEEFGINTFKREICSALGESFWNELTDGIDLPDMKNERNCECSNMRLLIKRLEERAAEYEITLPDDIMEAYVN